MFSPLIRRLRFILILAVSFQLSTFSSFSQAAEQYVRVRVLHDAGSLQFKVKGFYEIEDLTSHKILYKGKDLNTTVTVSKDAIWLGRINPGSNKILIKARDPGKISINGRNFRGHIELIKDKEAKLTVINYLGLEDYIKGIAVREISHYWPMEVLKAQVITFRTFALYKIEENKTKDYDLTSDVYSQVYGGRAAERYRIDKAIDETKGLVITYQGKIFPAFYHSTCGGHTEDASLLWGINLAPLKGVVCGFCRESAHFKWHYVAENEEVKKKLADAGYKIGKVDDIQILGRDASQRITDLKILSAKEDIRISAKDFRNILGPDAIRSTNFKVTLANSDIVFEGFGWGHGVGLCQWGSYFMAKQGYKFEEILKYYYPGAEVSLMP